MKYEFGFPDIGEGIAEGTLLKWLVKEGETIKEGQSIAEVETDKVTTEIPSPKSGKVIQQKFQEGDTIEVGQVFITLEVASLDNIPPVKQEKVEEETAGVVGEVIASSQEIPPSREGLVSPVGHGQSKRKVLATPVARKLAKDLGVDITRVKGTGPNGRVMKKDIGTAAHGKEQNTMNHQQNQEGIQRVPLSTIRKTIAKQMVLSKSTIPHVTAMDEVNVTPLNLLRKKYNEKFQGEGIHLTYLPFIIKALVVALKKYPEFNASLDDEKQELMLKPFYHIGIATDTPRGLMVPVLKDAHHKSIVEIAKEISDLSSRAKDNSIQLKELQGSTFSITNYGAIGGLFASPVINYPEVAILGLGRIVEKPIVQDEKIIIAKILPLSLTFDHRVIDGAAASRFMNTLKELLEDPEMLLLKS